MSPKEIIIRLRDPDCDCCPLYEECQNVNGCLLLVKAADCIEKLLQKGNKQ